VAGLSELKPQLPHSPYDARPIVIPSCLSNPKLPSVSVEDCRIKTIKNQAALGSSFLFSGIGSQAFEQSGAGACIVIANKAIPEIDCSLPYYFEISFQNASPQDHVSIGFVTDPTDLKRKLGVPGSPSWGLHVFENQSWDFQLNQKVPSSPNFFPRPADRRAKNVVGCCLFKQAVFFTLNGELSKLAFSGLPLKGLFPAIGVEGSEFVVSVNFGQSPFLFQDLPPKDINVCVSRKKMHIYCHRRKTRKTTHLLLRSMWLRRQPWNLRHLF